MRKRRILSALISAVMAVGCMAYMPQTEVFEQMTVEAANYGDYLYYYQVDEDEDNTYDYIEITACDESVTEIEIPSEIDGLSVTSIGNDAFYHCDSLTSITIPDSVTSIWGNTFSGCSELTSITIENPECEIYGSEGTINNGYDDDYNLYFNGTIYGYENSTAQAYAEKCGYNFEVLDDTPATTEPAVTTTTTTSTTVTTQTSISETTTVSTDISETTADTSTQTTTATTTTTTEPNKTPQGDANGDGEVNVRDASTIARFLAEKRAGELPLSADFNGDGEVNVRDAAAIAKALAKGEL